MRVVINNRASSIGINSRSIFSVSVMLGASKVPLAVDMMAESKAPKNKICAKIGAGKKYGQKKSEGEALGFFDLKNFLEYFLKQSQKFQI